MQEERGVTRRRLLIHTGRTGVAMSMLAPTLGVLAACDSDDDDGGGEQTREIAELRWALETAPKSLDIFQEVLTDSWVVQYAVTETLVGYSPTLELVPRLASKFDTPSPTEYVYTLRDGVTFHDGKPMTADDVVYSIERHVNNGSQVIGLNGVKSVRKTGGQEVTITLKAPDAAFAYNLVLAPIIPKAFAEQKGKQLGAQGGLNWIGTGPYKLESFGGDSIVIVRNEDYWGTKPAAKKATFSFVADSQTRRLALRSGQIDGTFAVPVGEIEEWKKLPEAETYSTPGLGVTFLSFNVAIEPWNDLHVRRAFAHALNQQAIIDAVLKGNARPANAMVAPPQWGGVAPAEEVEAIYEGLRDYPYDLDAAKAELAESNHADGFTAEIRVPDWADPDGTDAMLAFAADLKKIGVTLKVTSEPTNQWSERVYGHNDLGLEMLGWSPDYPDPQNYLILSYPSANAAPDNYNTANFKNERVDELLTRQAETTDNAERAEALAEVLRISQEQLPYLNVWWTDVPAATSKELTLADFNPLYYFGWIGNVRKSG